MRFLSGLILGVLLVVGVAYVHDAASSGSMSGPDPTGTRLVNWDVVGRSLDSAAAAARDAFDRLVGRHPAPPVSRGA